jgi:hypothetical protein
MSTTKSFTRRRFLQASSLAVAAPLILPSRIWSAQTRPNDRIALGFIGMGTQNRGLMGGFLGRPDCQVVAVCEVEPDRRAAAQKTVNDRYASTRVALRTWISANCSPARTSMPSSSRPRTIGTR